MTSKVTSKINNSRPSISLSCSQVRTRFTCSSCSTSFSSKYQLDCHIQAKCDKKKCSKTPNRRLFFKTKRSFIHSPVGTSTRKTTVKTPSVSTPRKSSTSILKITCNICSESFGHDSEFLRHKVARHGMETPDETLKHPNKEVKKRVAAHTGVPLRKPFKDVFANMGLILAEQTNTHIEPIT